MCKLSSLYAILEKNPVAISYPCNQPSIDSAPFELDKYKRDHDFITNYTFGKCSVEHREIEHRYNGLYKGKLFFTYETDFVYALIPQKSISVRPQDKPYIDLFEQIQRKAMGREIKNPFYDKISDSIYTLQYYIRNDLPCGSMSHDEAEKLFNQLNEIKLKLVFTQNIK